MADIPDAAMFNSRRVTNPGQSEVVRQRLFDYQIFPAGGSTQLTFFSQTIGQGITSSLGAAVGTAKTQWDTNLEMPNTLPSGKSYLIESIEVFFQAGSSATTNTFLPQLIANFEATAADAAVASFNDVQTFRSGGMLELNILSKNYLRETPLMAFPQKAFLESDGAVASNAAATGITSIGQARAGGRVYYIEPSIALQPAVNFEILLKWPAAVALPSGFNGRVGVILDGYLMRASQ